MVKGPLGFPRLTTIGPLVSEDSISVPHNVEEGIHSHTVLSSAQGKTYQDSSILMEEESRILVDFNETPLSRPVRVDDAEWRYIKMSLGTILDGNTFSLSLLDIMSSFEQEYGSFDMVDTYQGIEASNMQIESEVNKALEGKDSIFKTRDQLNNISAGITEAYDLGETRRVSEAREKIVRDFIRVLTINEDIRSEGIYWPPTVELGAKPDALFVGTIDGSHRIVALSQILGTDEEIYVWEWFNQEDFY